MLKKGKHLITTDNWFFAPDGESYKAVWGEVEMYTTKEAFGFEPSGRSTNWFIRVGKGERSIVIAGCQIHYAIAIERKPKDKRGVYIDKNNKGRYSRSRIYIP